MDLTAAMDDYNYFDLTREFHASPSRGCWDCSAPLARPLVGTSVILSPGYQCLRRAGFHWTCSCLQVWTRNSGLSWRSNGAPSSWLVSLTGLSGDGGRGAPWTDSVSSSAFWYRHLLLMISIGLWILEIICCFCVHSRTTCLCARMGSVRLHLFPGSDSVRCGLRLAPIVRSQVGWYRWCRSSSLFLGWCRYLACRDGVGQSTEVGCFFGILISSSLIQCWSESLLAYVHLWLRRWQVSMEVVSWIQTTTWV